MRVLVAVDGSESAVAAATFAAGLLNPSRDEVRIMTVLSYHLYPASLVPGEKTPGEREAAERVKAEVDRVTAGARSAFEARGFRTETRHRFGNAADEIVGEAAGWAPGLVVMGRRGVRGVERVLGSVSERVLHHLKGPSILLVP